MTDSDRPPYRSGAIAGALAWLVGYLVTYLHTAGAIRESPARRIIEFFGGEVPVWKVVGWVFYNEHFVSTVFEGPFGGARTFVGGEDGFTALLYLLPVLALALAGLAVARRESEPREAARAGVTVALGYLPLSVVGAFVFTVGTENVARPDLVPALLLAGVVYPLVLGAVGGLLATLVGDERAAGPSL